MMDEMQGANFYYLNRDGRWPDFEQAGLDLQPDGAWQLAAVPLLISSLPAEVADLSPPDGPAGLSIGPDGTIYFSQPEANQLLRIDGCDDTQEPFPCLSGAGSRPAQLRRPRGILYHPIRQAIFVADSGNHRVQIFDPHTFQLLDIWGQPDPTGEPEPDAEPGRLDAPWSLASDDEGNVYIVDYGNGRVQKFDQGGQLQPDFWQMAHNETDLSQPTAVAITSQDEQTRIYILDASQNKIVALDTAGHYLGEFGASILQGPMGLAVTDEAIYVGDNGRQRILKFKLDDAFTFVGTAHGYEGPVAALAVDHQDGLWLHPGGALAPLRLKLGKAHLKSGILWGGPFGPGDQPVKWHRFKAMAAPLANGAHLQFFVYTNDDPSQSPAPPVAAVADPFANLDWRPKPPDVLDGLISNGPAMYLWLGAHSTGEGLQSPHLHQVKVDFDQTTYRQQLPAIYSNDPAQRDLLDRLLSLFGSFFIDIEQEITHLGRLFDPEAAPPTWLPWLASWLALDLDENWSEAKQREAIANALAMYAKRGTVEGLRTAIRFFTGVEAHIEEPIRHAAWWALPTLDAENSVLGFTTMLAPAEAQGAVVGTTAVLDQSHLISQEEFGVPLFEDVAHQFRVQIYRGQVYSEQKVKEVRALIDREKPAHTDYHLCLIEPRMRVGFQARVGIDTVVAGPTPPTKLGEISVSGPDLTLGGALPGRIGQTSQVGQTTRLSGATATR